MRSNRHASSCIATCGLFDHIRPQYACRTCDTVTAEAIPAALIQGSLGAPGLHAWVAVQKFLDHLPLYRIEQISDRNRVPIARSTLAKWIGRIGVALQPLADRLAELLSERSILHADETPIPQLNPGNGKTNWRGSLMVALSPSR